MTISAPAYRRITEHLLTEVLPTLEVGDPLPTINELGALFQVTGVQTIRNAVQPLIDAGLVEIVTSPRRRWVLRQPVSSAPVSSDQRATSVQAEQAAVLAVQTWLTRHTSYALAEPKADVYGIDMLAYRAWPLHTIALQVKAAGEPGDGVTTYRKYDQDQLVIAYVHVPLSDTPQITLLTGRQAWRLPQEYQRRGGKATDYDLLASGTYRWPRMTALLAELLAEHAATPQLWDALCTRTSSSRPASSTGTFS